MEPAECDGKLLFQKTLVITFGFLFGYIDLTFDLGRPFDFKDVLGEFTEVKRHELND